MPTHVSLFCLDLIKENEQLEIRLGDEIRSFVIAQGHTIDLIKDDFKVQLENPETLLKLPVTQRSIVVMHGENFQTYFKRV